MDFHKEQEAYFLRTIEKLEHLPYIWGGDDPNGFDCSGMVLWGLQAVGMLPEGDMTANDLWVRFSKSHPFGKPTRGALAFWFDSEGKAYHVAVCLSDHFCMTANKGGHTTLTAGDAAKQNAYITLRPVFHRKTAPKFVYLWQ